MNLRESTIPNKEQELIHKYSYMFKYMEDKKELYPIKFGFECDDGWIPLIEILLKGISKIDIKKTVRVFQIKEKFGGLRFYIEFTEPVEYSKVIYNLITKAEEASYNICEVCGAISAKTDGKSRIKTLCKNCRNE